MNDDEWIVKRVADLEVGDDVRDYGPLRGAETRTPARERRLLFPQSTEHWPAHARVDIRRPVEVRVIASSSRHRLDVYVAAAYVATLPRAHAEEYAERLRGSADERRKALGQ